MKVNDWNHFIIVSCHDPHQRQLVTTLKLLTVRQHDHWIITTELALNASHLSSVNATMRALQPLRQQHDRVIVLACDLDPSLTIFRAARTMGVVGKFVWILPTESYTTDRRRLPQLPPETIAVRDISRSLREALFRDAFQVVRVALTRYLGDGHRAPIPWKTCQTANPGPLPRTSDFYK